MVNRITQVLNVAAQYATRSAEHAETVEFIQNLFTIMGQQRTESGKTDLELHARKFHNVLNEIKKKHRISVDEPTPILHEELNTAFKWAHYLKIADGAEKLATISLVGAYSGYVTFFQDLRAYDQTPTCDILTDEGCLDRIQGTDAEPSVVDAKVYLVAGFTFAVSAGYLAKKHIIPWAVREYNHFKERHLNH